MVHIHFDRVSKMNKNALNRKKMRFNLHMSFFCCTFVRSFEKYK